jgi:hypothetical protein
MPRIRPISLRIISALSSGFLFCSFALAAPSKSAEPNPWLEIHSTHFTVITDAGDKKGREVALRFEQMRAVFGILIGKEKLNLPVPLTIFALKSDKMFYQAAPLRQGQPIDVPGFFLPGADQNFIVLNVFEDESWRAVAHDFAHMLLNYNYPPAQGWFDEGLAEYFTSVRVDNRMATIGGDPELRASVSEDLLQNQHDTHPPKSLTELLAAQVWISLPDLFAMKHDSSTYVEGTHHTMFYAESWIVMHYLLHEKKLAEMGNYFDLVLNQQLPVEEAIQKAFGMSATQLEQAVKDYFHSLTALANDLDAARAKPDPNQPASTAQVYQFPLPIGPETNTIAAKPLPEADARAIYADIQVRIPERRELGLQALQTLATTPPLDANGKPKPEKKRDKPANNDSDNDSTQILASTIGNEIAHRALAWDHIQHGQFDDALPELSDAAILNPRDLWIRYYLAVLKYRSAQAKHGDIQGLPNMMQDLKNVLDWYPEMADAYDLLAVARMEGGSSNAAMQSERAAIALNPRDQNYIFHFAEIYIADKKWEAAQTLLERLKASGNPQVAAKSRTALEQVAAQRKYGIAGASLSGGEKLAPQKSPFDVLEEDAAKRAAADQAADSAGPGDRRPTKFLKGRLVDVDCSQTPVAVLTVSANGSVMKLRTADYKSLLLIGADQFSCEWTDLRVTANYKPGAHGGGDLVSLEVR